MSTESKSDFWQQHIDAWKGSGLSQTAYCQRHDLKLSTFTYWRNKQNKGRRKLVPVSMPVQDAPVELALPGGIHMQLPASALEQTLPLIWRLIREQA
ncbi:IS66 family insertion sequence element accessory protein TnpA [Microbulbifer halophilus]|uniref:IS66 family insertion sequence element accessory protein TnpB n=1 Tax=Microbulbifer halophilus TaxID=453963 RepID=A0ABW5EJS9_9GAMM|nr:IS66 family insertion sequence element accessory protein TnpB [Microbulbifer halophilus]MCW8128357.1 IS66 family insertion sequence element accessory protein TnpB [Microbulbifer halophilus]